MVRFGVTDIAAAMALGMNCSSHVTYKPLPSLRCHSPHLPPLCGSTCRQGGSQVCHVAIHSTNQSRVRKGLLAVLADEQEAIRRLALDQSKQVRQARRQGHCGMSIGSRTPVEVASSFSPNRAQTVRRDNCLIVKILVQTCLNKILIDRDIEGAQAYVRSRSHMLAPIRRPADRTLTASFVARP